MTRSVLALCALALLVASPTKVAGSGSNPAPAKMDSDRIRQLLQERRYAEAEAGARALMKRVEAEKGAGSVETADALDLLVESLWKGGKVIVPETRSLAERAVAIRKSRLPPDDLGVVPSLKNLAAILRMTGDKPAATGLHERVLRIQEAALGPDHLDVAKTLNNLAFHASEAGDPARSRAYYERAVRIFESVDPESLDLATLLTNFAASLTQAGELEKARDLHLRAIAIREARLEPMHPSLATGLLGLASVLRQLGDFDGARPLYERALAIDEKALGPEHLNVAYAVNGLAALMFDLQDLPRARALYERALGIWEKTLGPESELVAETLGNLGVLFKEVGDLAAALRYSEREMTILDQHLPADHPSRAITLANIGNLHRQMGDRVAAQEYLDRALVLAEKTPTGRATILPALEGLARLARDHGDYSRARSLYERALQVLATTPDHPSTGIIETAFCDLLLEQGRPSEARDHCERALGIYTRSIGPGAPLTAPTLENLAHLRYLTGERAAAVETALLAEAAARGGLRRTARGLVEREALLYQDTLASGLDVMLSVMADAGPGHHADTDRVFDALIRSRALLLEESSNRHRAAVDSGAAAISALRRSLVSAANRLSRLVVRGPDPEDGGYTEQVRAAQAEVDRIERELAERSQPFRLDLARSRAALGDVAGALPDRTALIAMARYQRVRGRRVPGDEGPRPAPSTPSYIAFVLGPDGKGAVAVPLGQDAERIDALVEDWRVSVSDPPTTGAAVDRYNQVASALRSAVWDPLVPHLGRAKRVLLVPDGSLHLVNFSTLPASDGRYLLEAGPLIHYLSAERDVVGRQAPARAGRGLLAVGGPDFDSRADDSGTVAVTPSFDRYRGRTTGCDEFQSLRFKSLPGALREVEIVSSEWAASPRQRAADPSVITLTRREASEGRVKAQAPGREVLHFATHAFWVGGVCAAPPVAGRGRSEGPEMQPGRPTTRQDPLLLSGLALAGANRRFDAPHGGESEDGILTAGEIASLDLRGVAWVVLSACETGVGTVRSGEGVFGLRRAFAVAGAGTLIMSLWSVGDYETAEWAERLYAARLAGRATDSAMLEASRSMLHARRKARVTTHPFFWGAFVAAGDWR